MGEGGARQVLRGVLVARSTAKDVRGVHILEIPVYH